MLNYIKIKFFICYFIFVFLTPAYAYLDPGTFSIVLQAILAFFAGIASTYKFWVHKLKNLINKIKNQYNKKK